MKQAMDLKFAAWLARDLISRFALFDRSFTVHSGSLVRIDWISNFAIFPCSLNGEVTILGNDRH